MRAILTYHSIDSSGSPISVSPAAFRRHLQTLNDARVAILALEELIAGPQRDTDAVALTFDDGFASVGSEALPILVERGLPATLFLVTDCVGATNRWAARDGHGMPEWPLLGWAAIERVALQGIAIESHTRTHPDLTRVSPAQVDDEIGGAAQTLKQRLGRAPKGFAYPYGAVNPAVRSAAGRMHGWACTTALRTLAGDAPLDLPRLEMWYFERSGRFEQWGTPAFDRWVRRRHHLRRLRASWRRMVRR